MKTKTTLSLLCLCVLSIGLIHRLNLFSANSSSSQQVSATAKKSTEQNSSVEQLLAKTQQAKVWKQAIQLNPQDAEAHHQLGLVLMTQDQVEEAMGHYQKAIALKPPNISRIYQNWGKALVKQSKTDDAIATFRQGIIQDYPDAPKAMQEAEVHFRLGQSLNHEGRLPEAIKAYRQAITAKPDRLIYEHLGNALAKHNQLDEAVSAFAQTRPKAYPGYPHRLLGDVLVRENRLDDALAAYHQWLDLDSKHPKQGVKDDYAHHALAVRLNSLNRIEPAQSAFRKALELTDPMGQPLIAQDLIHFLVGQNLSNEAQEVSQQYLRSDQPFQKANVQHLIEQSKDLIKANHLVQAEKNCRQAETILNNTQFLAHHLNKAEVNRKRADVWSCLGQVQARQGQLETALTSFRQEYQLNKYAYIDIAETLVKLQRPQEALNILRKESSQKVQAYNRLGNLLIANQQTEVAAQYCQKALAVDAQNLAAHRCWATAAGESKPVVVDTQLFQKRIKDISPKVIQKAYRANRLGNNTIGYTLHQDAIGVSHDEVTRTQTVMPHLAELNIYQTWGDVLAQQGKRQEAVAAYHQTLRLLPETAQTYTSLGKVLMQQQQYGGAIAAYRRAIQLSPYAAQSYVNLSKALQAVDQTETADLALQQAVQLGWQETASDQ